MTNSISSIAFYARYSCEQQKESSIEDQLRRCRDIASQFGLNATDAQIYTDEALSGTAKHNDKRTGYQALLTAWDAGRSSVLIVDEFSRLTRDGVEQAKLVQRRETNRRVRLVTANGIDTAQENWQMNVGLIGLVGQQATRDTQHRVERGMVGQLYRGFMIATPAYGYELKRELDARGVHVGSHWVLSQPESDIVREIYARRERGQSMQQIATWLNEAGVACSRKAKREDGGYWRPARIRQLLSNPIYAGRFVFHGSNTHRAMADKLGIAVVEEIFERPELRLISDEVWHRCNSPKVQRSISGGGKHVLAGLITCGCCGGTLVLSAHRRAPSVYCANCTVAKAVTAHGERQTVTVAAAGVQLLLTKALRYFLTPAFLEAFRNSLRAKLQGDLTSVLKAAQSELARLQRVQERLSHMLTSADADDPVLTARYDETRCRVRAAQSTLTTLEAGQERVDRRAIEAQLEVEPATLLDGLFDTEIPPERVRAVLRRLFPELLLEGKLGRYTSTFRIRFAVGAALSLASETETVMDGEIVARFQLKYTPDNRSGHNESRWAATLLEGELLILVLRPLTAEHPQAAAPACCSF